MTILHAVVVRALTSYPYKAGTEHARVSSDHAGSQSPSAKCRDVFGESHRG
ncbi:unnamed protein product [Sphacelaria rigidula]